MINFSDSIEISVRALFLRKLRTLLSTLGIIFGVAAVISMESIGEGARRQAAEQVKLLGTNNIRIKQIDLTGEKGEEAKRQYAAGLTYEDAELIQIRFSTALRVAPMNFVDAEIRFEGQEAVGQILGITTEYENITGFRVGVGRFLKSVDLRDHKRVCILGTEVKQELFGYRNALGATVTIGQELFTVVGVMESKVVQEGKVAVIKVRNINRDVYIPITTSFGVFSLAGESSGIEEIAIRVTRSQDLYPAADEIKKLLAEQHRGIEDFQMIIPEELLAQAQKTQRIFSIIMGSIAGISLLVGGIGIMNIMLANISERTREIGIRRAIGATQGDISAQFLIETVLVCLTGGIIGIFIGSGMAMVITLYAGWETAFSLSSILLAFGAAGTVGLLFGIFPARRAAQLDPIKALRFE